MCSISREMNGKSISYALAAIHLWEDGQRKAAAWLIEQQGIEFHEWKDRNARGDFIYSIKPIYEYAAKMAERAARRTVPRATILETV